MKMKLFWAASLAVATLASCSQDENLNGEAVSGVPTLAKVEFVQVANTMAAPPSAAAATADESKLSSVCVYIFDAQTKTLVTQQVFNAASIATGAETFMTTSGERIFYAVANLGNYSQYAPGTFLSTIQSEELDIAAISAATTPNNFWMTSLTEVRQTLNPGITQTVASSGTTAADNCVKIQIGRATAKVSCDFMAPNTITAQPNGELTNVMYRVKQLPIKMYRLPYSAVAGVNWTTPFYAENSPVATNYSQRALSAANRADFKAAGVVGNQCDNPFYAVENKNDSARHGNTTYLAVSGTYTPRVTLKADGTTPMPGSTGSTFYRVRAPQNGPFMPNYYRESMTQTQIDAILPGGELIEYTNGISYYRVWLKDDSQSRTNEKYSVKRNNHYWVTINTVADAGENEEGGIDPKDPDRKDPIEVETYMKATIEVINWTVVEQNTGI